MLGKASGKYRDFFSEGKQTDTIIEKRKEEKSGVCVCMHVIERERERKRERVLVCHGKLCCTRISVCC